MKFSYVIAAFAALSVSPVYAACTMPAPMTNMPNGQTATAQDILDSQKSLLALQSKTDAYLDCVKKEHDAAVAAAGPGITTVQADKLDQAEDKQHNAAVRQLNDSIKQFNAQVAIFKAKHAPKAPAAKKSDSDKH
jgi:hypothetical protein